MKRALLCILLLLPGLATAATLEGGYLPETPSSSEVLIKSALLPGLGQIEQGRTGRGAIWAGGATVLALAPFHSHMEYRSAAQDYNNAEDRYRSAIAEGDADAALAQFSRMKHHNELAEDRYGTRRLLEITLLTWWAGNLVDAWLFEDGDAAEGHAALPGRIEPVLLRGEAAGLAWTLDF